MQNNIMMCFVAVLQYILEATSKMDFLYLTAEGLYLKN